MKQIKYILLTIILFLIATKSAYAVCRYGNDNLNFTCDNSDGKVSCTVGGRNSDKTIIGTIDGKDIGDKDYSKLSENDINACTTIYVTLISYNELNSKIVSVSPNDTIYAYLHLTKDDVPNVVKNYNIIPLELKGTSYNSSNPSTNYSDILKKYSGRTCTYEQGNITYKCEIVNGNPVCGIGCVESPCLQNYTNTSTDNIKHKFDAASFLDDSNNFVCPSSANGGISFCGNIEKISTYKSNYTITSVGEVCSGAAFDQEILFLKRTPLNDKNPSSSVGSVDVDGPEFKDASCDTLLGGIADKDAPAYYLNFAFNLLKYAAIVVLFVLSIIEYAKAIAASNQDGIKKATQTTIKRILTAVIIFLLPILINFIFDILGIISTDPTCGIGTK